MAKSDARRTCSRSPMLRRRIVRRPRAGTLGVALCISAVLVWAQVVSAGAQAASVTVTSSSNPSTYGQSVTFNAQVSGLGGLLGQGTVQFQVDGANVGSAVSVSLGAAAYTTSALGGGSHTVTANYASSGGNGSGTLPGGQVVNKASTTLKLSSSNNPAPAGSSIILSASIAVTAPGAGSPVGAVSFVSGNLKLGSVNVSGGLAYLTVSPDTLPVGSEPITATYAGNGDFSGSSATLTQTVSGSGTGSPGPTPSKTATASPTPTRTPSPRPTKSPTPVQTVLAAPSPAPSPTFVAVPIPTSTFTTALPTSFPTLAASPPPPSSASKSSKLRVFGFVILLVSIVAAVIVALRRRTRV